MRSITAAIDAEAAEGSQPAACEHSFTGVMVAGAAFWGALTISPAAFAHAVFEGATPEPNARLAEGPQEIVLRFSEPVTPVSVRLLNSHLQDVGAVGNPEIDRRTARQPTPQPARSQNRHRLGDPQQC